MVAVLLSRRAWSRTSKATPTRRRRPRYGPEVQWIPGGPVASQVAIKQIGTNGGGPFNANSAHPLENPNGWTDLVEIGRSWSSPSRWSSRTAGWSAPAPGRRGHRRERLPRALDAWTGSGRSSRATPLEAWHRPGPGSTRWAATSRAKSALRTVDLRTVGGGHDGRVERLGEQHARQLHADGRHRSRW